MILTERNISQRRWSDVETVHPIRSANGSSSFIHSSLFDVGHHHISPSFIKIPARSVVEVFFPFVPSFCMHYSLRFGYSRNLLHGFTKPFSRQRHCTYFWSSLPPLAVRTSITPTSKISSSNFPPLRGKNSYSFAQQSDNSHIMFRLTPNLKRHKVTVVGSGNWYALLYTYIWW